MGVEVAGRLRASFAEEEAAMDRTYGGGVAWVGGVGGGGPSPTTS